LIAWVDGGAKEGNPRDAPDLVLEMPNAFEVPATGQVDYQYVILPTNLKEDRWIQTTEVRPSDRCVMHHVIAFIREPGSKWMADAKPGIAFVPPRGSRGEQLAGGLGSYVPGQVTVAPAGTVARRATLLKAGSDIVFQLHYTPNGKATTDKTKIGIIFAKEPPSTRLVGGNSASYRFAIPPGESNYKVEGTSTLQYDCELVSMMPDAHLRAKAFEYRIVLSGSRQVGV
jgi:hypothetical protein